MATLGYTGNTQVSTQFSGHGDAPRERTIEEIVSEACNAAVNALALIEAMESAPAPARDQAPVPPGLVAGALYLHATIGELHQRVVRLGERIGKL